MTAKPPAGAGEAAQAVSQPETSVKTEVKSEPLGKTEVKPEPSGNTEVKPEPVGDTEVKPESTGNADGQPESAGNTDTYVTTLSKEEEDRLLKASHVNHI